MKHSRAVARLVLLIVVFTALFTTLLSVRYRTFFSHDWRDEAVDNQIIYNSAHGRPVYSTIKGPMIFHRHFRPIFMVVSLPWLIFDKIYTWFFTVSLLLGLGALAVYGFARKRFRSVSAGFFFAVAFLLWPPLHEVLLGNYDPETLVVTFWLFAVLAYDSEKLWKFWIWAVLAMICKETQAPVIFGFGVVAIIQRRNIKWWLPALIVGPLWFFAAIEYIIPLYHPTFDTIYGRFVGCKELDPFPGCFLSSLMADPALTLKAMLSVEHLELMWGVGRALLLFPLLGIVWLIPAVPVALEILVLSDPLPIRQAHILSGLLPFVFIGGIVGAHRATALLCRIPRLRPFENKIPLLFAAVFIVSSISFSFANGLFGQYQNYGTVHEPGLIASSVFSKKNYTQSVMDNQAWNTIALIPKTAPAMTNNRFLLALSSRPLLREFGTQHSVEDFDEIEFLLVSFFQPPCPTCTYTRLNVENLSLLKILVDENHFRVARAFADHALLIRNNVDGPPEDTAAKSALLNRLGVMIEMLILENQGIVP